MGDLSKKILATLQSQLDIATKHGDMKRARSLRLQINQLRETIERAQ